MKAKTREDAINRGEHIYYPVTLCQHGHSAGRYTINGRCCVCSANYQRVRNASIKDRMVAARARIKGDKPC